MEDEFGRAKKKVEKKSRIWASIDSRVHDKFMNYCDKNGYDRSKLLELIIKKFVEVKGE